MPDTSLDVTALVLIALLFGLRHGLDADHLSMIDGLARLQARAGRFRLSRLCGVLFSAGHGLVILVAAFILQHFGGRIVPAWLEPLGAWISILFLFSVGVTNLRNASEHGATPAPTPITRWALQFPLLHAPVGAFIVGSGSERSSIAMVSRMPGKSSSGSGFSSTGLSRASRIAPSTSSIAGSDSGG